MGRYLLECCVDSVESAIIAQEGGADRLELCSNLIIGGTTPGIKFYEEVRRRVKLPVHVLIRPRYGDFLYSSYEFSVIEDEVRMFREAGAEGIVIGCLKPEGIFDMERMYRLKELGEDMKFTVHRAFDLVKSPLEAFDELLLLGADTLLTSGQQKCCVQGRKLLQELVDKSQQRINVMAGGGVNAKVAEQLLETTGVTQLHMSGKEVLHSRMEYRNGNVNMGLPTLSEYEIVRANQNRIQEIKNLLRKKESELCYFPNN